MRSCPVAAGPAFRPATSIASVTGHPDLAPTVLRILGLDPPPHMDGRVIEEALVDGFEGAVPHPEQHLASRVIEGGEYSQRLFVAPAVRGGHLLSASANILES